MALTEQQKMLKAAGHGALVVNMLLSEALATALQDSPIDGTDLNPHLQVEHIADLVVAAVKGEGYDHITREQVLLMWLTENILDMRNDKASREL